jgi:polysaccharide deacetylase family protein (PEP-CTERM system associated)
MAADEKLFEQPLRNALTIDVEDYFHVSAFEEHIPRSNWGNLPCRIEQNVERILALLQGHDIRATFFVLGWVAERYPALVRSIVGEGHELASHGYEHIRVTRQKRKEFSEDIVRTKRLLEDVGGRGVIGYRAASYSIGEGNLWAHDELREAGYCYSSSIYPIRHDLYGMPSAPRFAFNPLAGDSFLEIPITTTKLLGKQFPGGGGGYFRLYPYSLSRWILRRVNQREGQPGVFYFHPWEIDPDQPKQTGVGAKTRFRHYLNLHRTEERLDRLLADFGWDRMDKVFWKPSRAKDNQS